MSSTPEGEHTLKGIRDDQYLPPLRKQILLYLAENRPQSKYSTAQEMNGHYKSTSVAIDDLADRKILAEIKEEEYRNQKHMLYWLTPAGVFIALVKGVNAKTVLKRTIDVYPDNKMLQCIVELTTILGTDAYQIGYQAILKKGKLEKSDISLMMGTLLLKELSLEQIMALIALMKKYPEQYGDFKEQTNELVEKFKKAEMFLKDAMEEG